MRKVKTITFFDLSLFSLFEFRNEGIRVIWSKDNCLAVGAFNDHKLITSGRIPNHCSVPTVSKQTKISE